MSRHVGGDGAEPAAFKPTPARSSALARCVDVARAWADRDGRAGFVLFAALFAVALMPVLMTPIPAMVDYVNHLARMYVIVANGTPDASPFYGVTGSFYPNLAMDLVVPRLAQATGVELATRIFLLASQIMIVTGALAIELAVKRRFQISGYFALLFLYSVPFAWGFLNFEFALGLALWATACWLALRDRAWLVRFATHTLFVGLLFVSHLFALGLYGVTLGIHELWAARTRRVPAADTVFTMLTLAAPAVAFGGFMAVYGGPVGQAVNTWNFALKPLWLFRILNGYSVVLSTVSMATLLVLLYALAKRRALRFEASGAWLAVGFALLYLVVPARLLDTAFVDIRVILAAFLIVPAFVTVSFPSERWRLVATAIVAGLTLANIGLATAVWASYRADYQAMIGSFARLDEGSRVLVGHSGAGDDPPMNDLTDYPIYHAPTLAAHYAKAFVPTLFTTVGKQPIAVLSPYRRLAHSCGGPIPTAFLKAVAEGTPLAGTPEFVRSWPRDFDYLYVVGAPTANPMPGLLDTVEAHRRFTLYRIRRQTAGHFTSRPPAAG